MVSVWSRKQCQGQGLNPHLPQNLPLLHPHVSLHYICPVPILENMKAGGHHAASDLGLMPSSGCSNSDPGLASASSKRSSHTGKPALSLSPLHSWCGVHALCELCPHHCTLCFLFCSLQCLFVLTTAQPRVSALEPGCYLPVPASRSPVGAWVPLDLTFCSSVSLSATLAGS